MHKKLFIFFVVLLFSKTIFCQSTIIENLKKQYQLATTNDSKLEALINLCNYSESLHNDTLLYYASIIKELVAPDQNIGKNALAESFIGLAKLKKGFADSANLICENALQGLNYNNEYKNSYTKIKRLEASIAIRKQEYQKALEIFLPLLNDEYKKKDTFYIINNTAGIGYTYMEMGQNKDALEWFKKTLPYKNFNLTKRYFGIVNSNIAAVFNELNQNDSAEKYIKEAIELNEKYQQYSILANSYAIYSDILTDTKRVPLAEEPLLKAIAIRKQIGDPYFIVSDMAQLGIFYANNNQTTKGIAICDEGIALAKQFHLTAKLPFLYSTLAQNYKVANNKDAYINTLEKIITLKDSIYSLNSEKAIAESKTKYDAQIQELKLIQNKKELQKGNTSLLFSLATLLFAVALLLFLLWKRKKIIQM